MSHHILHLLTLTLFFTLTFSTHSPPLDSSHLLSFKLKADPLNKLNFKSSNFCQWQGIQCTHFKVHRLILQNLNLAGTFPPNTLTQLDQLRVLSLQNNSLTGPIPNLSSLINLKSLFLNHNSFSGSFPPSLISLHRLKTLDLSLNNLTGSIPLSLTNLDRLYYLRLDLNHLKGSIPPLNQSSLKIFNISHNNLTGPIPVTSTLLRFKRSSFLFNSRLCGEIVHRECKPAEPFFGSAAPKPINQIIKQQPKHTKNKNTNKLAAIIGLCGGVFVICFVICVITRVVKRKRYRKKIMKPTMASDYIAAESAAAVMKMEEDRALEEKVKKLQMAKSGSLVFCAGEAQDYTMEQLMKASAELLGKGTIGTTYKAVLDNRLIVCVKRLDGFKMTGISKEEFDRQMTAVGGLRHPKLVALRGFIQAKEERLLVYDYQPNGSLFSLIHGSKSARARPLHWTSCLKIAEDVAQGLNYIHQAWRFVHGNLKASNILLDPDFEACLTDYCLSGLVDPALLFEEPDSVAYKAPETHKLDHQPTSKSDIYSFGVLLIELLTGKPPSQHPYLLPDELVHWVRSMRDDDGSEDNRLVMLLEVAITCSATSPEQRPTMWQVLKMIQEIKRTVVAEDGDNAFPTKVTSLAS
ncbi:putative inactive receptor kinase At5g67200 [Apium graveolens]|uniref:putative inactive receptor kinase At5g67200 n=1 Tax=Apium graveolens TaxID=4045 RepID=UPI003D7B9E74